MVTVVDVRFTVVAVTTHVSKLPARSSVRSGMREEEKVFTDHFTWKEKGRTSTKYRYSVLHSIFLIHPYLKTQNAKEQNTLNTRVALT
jgi:hypothetical protein